MHAVPPRERMHVIGTWLVAVSLLLALAGVRLYFSVADIAPQIEEANLNDPADAFLAYSASPSGPTSHPQPQLTLLKEEPNLRAEPSDVEKGKPTRVNEQSSGPMPFVVSSASPPLPPLSPPTIAADCCCQEVKSELVTCSAALREMTASADASRLELTTCQAKLQQEVAARATAQQPTACPTIPEVATGPADSSWLKIFAAAAILLSARHLLQQPPSAPSLPLSRSSVTDQCTGTDAISSDCNVDVVLQPQEEKSDSGEAGGGARGEEPPLVWDDVDPRATCRGRSVAARRSNSPSPGGEAMSSAAGEGCSTAAHQSRPLLQPVADSSQVSDRLRRELSLCWSLMTEAVRSEHAMTVMNFADRANQMLQQETALLRLRIGHQHAMRAALHEQSIRSSQELRALQDSTEKSINAAVQVERAAVAEELASLRREADQWQVIVTAVRQEKEELAAQQECLHKEIEEHLHKLEEQLLRAVDERDAARSDALHAQSATQELADQLHLANAALQLKETLVEEAAKNLAVAEVKIKLLEEEATAIATAAATASACHHHSSPRRLYEQNCASHTSISERGIQTSPFSTYVLAGGDEQTTSSSVPRGSSVAANEDDVERYLQEMLIQENREKHALRMELALLRLAQQDQQQAASSAAERRSVSIAASSASPRRPLSRSPLSGSREKSAEAPSQARATGRGSVGSTNVSPPTPPRRSITFDDPSPEAVVEQKKLAEVLQEKPEVGASHMNADAKATSGDVDEPKPPLLQGHRSLQPELPPPPPMPNRSQFVQHPRSGGTITHIYNKVSVAPQHAPRAIVISPARETNGSIQRSAGSTHGRHAYAPSPRRETPPAAASRPTGHRRDAPHTTTGARMTLTFTHLGRI